MELKENIPLAPLTTFGIGGLARYLAPVQDIQEMREALSFAKKEGLEIFILGGGSNVLISENGFDGLVIKIEIGGIEINKEGGSAVLIAGAGEDWDVLVKRAVQEELWGVENLSGIPGTVGGAVSGNIGAYGQALSQTFLWAEVVDTASGEMQTLSNEECSFGYRDSFFKHGGNSLMIVRAAFTLSAAASPELSYKDLKERFDDSSADIMAVREAILAVRRGKFPDLSLEGTAGSFFKNPILQSAEARALAERYPQMPLFEMPETAGIKIPLAWLLDKILHMRGLARGGARLFEKQPLVIVVEKNCSASDVIELAEEVQTRVKETLGIEIEKEVKII